METIYCWFKFVDEDRLEEWETRLLLAEVSYVLDKPVQRKRWRFSSYATSRTAAEDLCARYGGAVEPILPEQWQPKPLVDGGKLIKVRDSLLVTGTEERESLEQLQRKHPGRIVLSFPPQLAFGTGEHPTTVGCLRFLADFAAGRAGGPWSVIDLGCGSGILAIAAAALGATRVVAVENDSMALGYARENAVRHGVAEKIEFVEGDAVALMAEKGGPAYDLIAANLFSDLLAELFPLFPARLASGGGVIVSGFLATQAELVFRYAEEAGLPLADFLRRGKWMAARSMEENRSSQNGSP